MPARHRGTRRPRHTRSVPGPAAPLRARSVRSGATPTSLGFDGARDATLRQRTWSEGTEAALVDNRKVVSWLELRMLSVEPTVLGGSRLLQRAGAKFSQLIVPIFVAQRRLMTLIPEVGEPRYELLNECGVLSPLLISIGRSDD